MPSMLRTSHRAVEIAVAVVFIALGGLVLYDAIRLGPGWGGSGPQPGFFPFVLTIFMVSGAVAVLAHGVTRPDRRPFFEDAREVDDLLKVGVPIAIVLLVLPWAGLYAASGVYLAFFMAWYGKFRWYHAIAGGILLPLILWLTLRHGFNLTMPMSVLYERDVLPF